MINDDDKKLDKAILWFGLILAMISTVVGIIPLIDTQSHSPSTVIPKTIICFEVILFLLIILVYYKISNIKAQLSFLLLYLIILGLLISLDYYFNWNIFVKTTTQNQIVIKSINTRGFYHCILVGPILLLLITYLIKYKIAFDLTKKKYLEHLDKENNIGGKK